MILNSTENIPRRSNAEAQTEDNIFSCVDTLVSSKVYRCVVCSQSTSFRCWHCGLVVYCSCACKAKDDSRHRMFCTVRGVIFHLSSYRL